MLLDTKSGIIIYKYHAIERTINNMTYTSLVILVKVSNKSVSDNHVCQLLYFD